MVVLSILLGIVLFLTVDLIVQRWVLAQARRTAARRAPSPVVGPSAGPITDRLTEVPSAVSLAPGHAWLQAEADGHWRIGADALLATLLGAPDFVELAPPGTWVEPQDALATLRHGTRVLTVYSPVRGRVIDSNLQVGDDPPRLLRDPYGEGWLSRLAVATPNGVAELHTGMAGRTWMAAEVRRLRDKLAELAGRGPVGAVAFDGGPPAPDFASRLDDDTWHELVASFVGPSQTGGRP
ncbi:MAG: glycine cleavage system protein H [Myxococcota bacterium]